ncbi:MAG: hypothetical protein DDT26_00108 [Dehalococcoidia bacterium]|nr:hypothetical protein [Chloroflexota bacterium]
MTNEFFLEAGLPYLGIDYGMASTFRFNTTVLSRRDGQEQRVANWQSPLFEGNLGDRTLTETELTQLLGFFRDRQGPVQGWRLRDWSDYQLKNELQGFGNGFRTQFPLIKRYNLAGLMFIRHITKPDLRNCVVMLNGVRMRNWRLRLSTGLLEFFQPPPSGASVTVSCSFSVPVRFVSDEFPGAKLEARNGNESLYSVGPVPVREIRLPQSRGYLQGAENSEPELDVGVDIEEELAPQSFTNLSQSANGWERREPLNPFQRRVIRTAARVIDDTELNYYLRFFRTRLGQWRPFRIKDVTTGGDLVCRFSSDSFPQTEFLAYDGNQALWNFAGFEIITLPLEFPTETFFRIARPEDFA